MRRAEVCFALVAALMLARPAVSRAQGYGVYEQSACTMGRGGTAAAKPCADGSGMYFNPAGIAGLPLSGSLGGTLIRPSTTWANDNTGIRSEFLSKTYPVPNLYFVAPVAQRFALGFGVFVPYGLTTEWDTETFEGRFLGYKTSLKAIYLQPTAAAQFGKLKIGAGLDITSLSVDLERKLDLSSSSCRGGGAGSRSGVSAFPTAPTSPMRTVTGSAWGVGYNLGATSTHASKLTLGVRYLARQKITADGGTAEFTQDSTGLVLTGGQPARASPGTPVDALVAPQFAAGRIAGDPGRVHHDPAAEPAGHGSRGDAHQAADRHVRCAVHLVGGAGRDPARLRDPPDFEALVLNDESVWTWRFGAELLLNQERDLKFRLGYIFHEAAAPAQSVIPNLPEANRNDYSVGFGIRITKTIHLRRRLHARRCV